MEKLLQPAVIDGKYRLCLKRDFGAVYGFGEKFDSVNQAGKLVRCMVEEKCFHQGPFTYLSMPFFVSTEGFGIYVDTYLEVDFDFTKEGEVGISFAKAEGEAPSVYLYEGTMKEILTAFRRKAGMPKMFPRWSLGAWMSSNRWHNEKEVREQLAYKEKYHFPHSVLVIEPWSEPSTWYLFKGSKGPVMEPNEGGIPAGTTFHDPYPDPKKLIDDIHKAGLKLVLWTAPSYPYASAKGGEHQEQWKSDIEYASKHHLEVLKKDGEPYIVPETWFIGDMIPDFTSPEGNRFYFAHSKYLLDWGVDGWKTDGGEFIHQEDVLCHDGETGLTMKNHYPDLYESEYAKFAGKDRILFSRSGGQLAPTNTIVWAGDQQSSWDEYRSILKAGLSAGWSGISTWGYDIAGFSGQLPTEELYKRALMMACFTPIMQWHSDPVSNGGWDFTGAWPCNDRSPWNIAAFHKDPSLLDLLRPFFFLHYNLVPYEYQLMKESHETGIPAMRQLTMEFPKDKLTWNIEDEYLLGDALLVAPILEDYIDTREVYLPEGEWWGLFDGKKREGGKKVSEKVLPDVFPVYLRSGKCVPLNLNGPHLMSDVSNQVDGYHDLSFLVAGEGKYHFVDDLGNDIAFSWDRHSHQLIHNISGIPFQVIHIEDGDPRK